MATNNDIDTEIDELKQRLRDDFSVSPTIYSRFEVLIKDKTRAEMAKQLFAELDKIAWQQIEPAKLKQFYKEFSGAKDEQAALEIAKKYSVVGFSTEKFDAIKKQYGVD